MNKMVELFWVGFSKFKYAYGGLLEVTQNPSKIVDCFQQKKSADVIPFVLKKK